jgi:hypothetical protein
VSRSRLIAALVFAIGGAGALFGWLATPAAPVVELPADVEVAHPLRAAASGPSSASSESKVAAASIAPPAASAPALWDLCGFGRTPAPLRASSNAPDAWQHLPAPLGEHSIAAARTRLLEGLAVGTERQRAAALLMQVGFTGIGAMRAQVAAQLVSLARAARDPALSAWALSVCEFETDSCDASDARRWVDIERDNAAAWIALSRRKGISPVELHRGLEQATHHTLHYGALAATVRNAWPATEVQYVQVPLLVDALAVDAALAVPLVQGTLAPCTPPPQAGSPQQRGCDALAESMVQRSDMLVSHTVGTAIGEKLGWSAERVAALRADNKALLAAQPSFEGAHQAFSCESVEQLRSWIDAVSRSGEVASARARRGTRR